jgi:NAD(P)H-hydrate epimerase
MKFLNADQIRTLDKRMIQERKCAGMMLMNRAGLAVAQVIAQLATVRNEHRRVTFVAGKGNNGGDALVAARHLYESGWHVGVLMTCLPAKLEGDAYEAWNDLHAAGIVHQVLADARDWEDASCDGKATARLPITGIIVDGLLGTGSEGAPHGVAAAAIRWIRSAHKRAVVVAIDIPSGVDADTGAVAGDAVTADITVTFAYPKVGFLNPAAQCCLGHVVVADIGIQETIGADAERESDERIQLIAAPELNRLLPIRPEFAHKRLFGHIGVIAGARGYSGAPALTVTGALRAGAGLITAAVPPESMSALAAHAPEAMAYPLDAPDGVITVGALERWGRSLDDFDCIAMGPGMTAADTTRDVVQWVLDRYDGRVVLDADALNVLPRVTLRKPERLILTPHPGEAARLLGLTPAAVQADRLGAVIALAARFGGTVVLKGASTLVCEAAGDPWITFTGNPGMATGGSGDVLTGIIAAMAARPMAALDAARLGVWLHGAAGDFAMWRESQEALTALDITRSLSHAFAMLRNA